MRFLKEKDKRCFTTEDTEVHRGMQRKRNRAFLHAKGVKKCYLFVFLFAVIFFFLCAPLCPLWLKTLFLSYITACTSPLLASARRKTILHPVPGDRPGVRGPNRSGAKGTPLLQPPHGVGDGGTQWSRPTCVRRGGGPKKPPPSGAIGTTAAVRAGKARHAAPARATGPRGCRTLGFNDRHLSPAGLRGGWLVVMVMNAKKIDPRRPRRTRNRTNFKKNHFVRAVTGAGKMPVLKKSVLIRVNPWIKSFEFLSFTSPPPRKDATGVVRPTPRASIQRPPEHGSIEPAQCLTGRCAPARRRRPT